MTGRVTVKSESPQTVVEVQPNVYVQGDVFGIVKRIVETWPELRVQYLDPSLASDVTEAPYRIVERCPDGTDAVVCYAWELDERILERIHQADTWRHTNKQQLLFEMELHNKMVRDRIKKDGHEKMEAVQEMAADVLASPKDTYTARNPVDGKLHKFTAVKKTGQKNV